MEFRYSLNHSTCDCRIRKQLYAVWLPALKDELFVKCDERALMLNAVTHIVYSLQGTSDFISSSEEWDFLLGSVIYQLSALPTSTPTTPISSCLEVLLTALDYLLCSVDATHFSLVHTHALLQLALTLMFDSTDSFFFCDYVITGGVG
jgi:hypothetical protein